MGNKQCVLGQTECIMRVTLKIKSLFVAEQKPNHAVKLKANKQIQTSFKLSLQSGQYGVWSKQRSRQFLQNECPQGVVTGSKNNLKSKKVQVSFHAIHVC